MDTPTIAQYYREQDPMKRLELLNQSIEAGEEPEANAIRKELWEGRYKDSPQTGKDMKADGYLALWMAMEFNRKAGSGLFGSKGARKEINKKLDELKFQEIRQKGALWEELLYRECRHMVNLYIELCGTDKSYNTTFCGIISISKDKAKKKLQKDIYETAIALPEDIQMQEELGMITRAAREMYEFHFPGEGGL